MIQSDKTAYRFDGPGFYRIHVLGEVDPRFSDKLGGMNIHVITDDQSRKTTQLSGEVLDQGALMGILTFLYDRHLSLISVECVDNKRNETINDSY